MDAPSSSPARPLLGLERPAGTGLERDPLHAQALEHLARLRAGSPPGAPIDGRGLRLIGADLEGIDLSGADLSGADLSRARLRGAHLLGARLTGAVLHEADLAQAELTGADLVGVRAEGADLSRAGLGHARLDGARLARACLRGATLTEASLRSADLVAADLTEARARGADLERAELVRACLREAELDQARVAGAVLDGADLRGASLAGLLGYRAASWIGVDLREIDFTGAYLCRSFIMDQNFIAEFRAQSRWTRVLYQLWRLTSDCGRSVTRWAFCTLVLVFLYAWLFTLTGVDYGDHPTAISPLYFSVVTLTTLGYGDVVPAGTGAQVVAMLEVLTGYVMLGGLLSIFSNKMASRAS